MPTLFTLKMIHIGFISLIILILIYILGAMYYHLKYESFETSIYIKKSLLSFALCLTILGGEFCIYGFISEHMYETGIINYNKWQSTPILDYVKKSKTTLLQNVFNIEQLNDKALIVLYKYGCSDCEKNYQALLDIQKRTKTYYIESNSQLGKHLIAMYKLTYVPSLLLWDKTSKTKNSIIIKDLANDLSEKTVLNTYIEKIYS